MEQQQQPQQEVSEFEKLGVCPEILRAMTKLGYRIPTPIQQQTLPYTLKGRDIIALAETGSGKTLAFITPIIQKLLEK
jgi:ATP-dependent RNA helicase DDX47/RRP3